MKNLNISDGFLAMEKAKYGKAREIFESILNEKKDIGLGYVHLGWMYSQGLGGPRDLSRAECCYKLARSFDIGLSSFYMGKLIWESGDPDAARVFMEESASQNNISGAYWAYLYNKGHDEKKSYEFLIAAEKLGHIYAMRDMNAIRRKSCRSFCRRVKNVSKGISIKILGVAIAIGNPEDPRIR